MGPGASPGRLGLASASTPSLKRRSDVAVVAPHGGLIEPGTSEITWALARSTCSAHSFDGRKARRNGDLHITSTR